MSRRRTKWGRYRYVVLCIRRIQERPVLTYAIPEYVPRPHLSKDHYNSDQTCIIRFHGESKFQMRGKIIISRILVLVVQDFRLQNMKATSRNYSRLVVSYASILQTRDERLSLSYHGWMLAACWLVCQVLKVACKMPCKLLAVDKAQRPTCWSDIYYCLYIIEENMEGLLDVVQKLGWEQ